MKDKKKLDSLSAISDNELGNIAGGLSNAKVDMYNSVIDGISESVDSNKVVESITNAGAKGIKSVLNSMRD